MKEIVRLKIKVVPGASRSGIGEWLGDRLKIRVAAQPEKGRANSAVVKLLANELLLPDSAFSIVSGTTSPQKVVEIRGIMEDELLQKLAVSKS